MSLLWMVLNILIWMEMDYSEVGWMRMVFFEDGFREGVGVRVRI